MTVSTSFAARAARSALRGRDRCGYTLFEVLVVMTLLLLLAAVILPSVGAFRGDSRQRAASDVVRAELAIARARAMEEGRPYRVAISDDGTRIRRAPESSDFAQVSAFDRPSGSSSAVDYQFEHVTAGVVTEQDGAAPSSADGWVTIATVLPDGTCREDTTLLAIKEDERPDLFVRVRGLTGASRVVPSTTGNGGAK